MPDAGLKLRKNARFKYRSELYRLAMNRKILALTITVLLTAALISATNANALTSVESKALNVILKLSQQVRDKLTSNIQPTLTTIKQDLQFKKKFWQATDELNNAFDVEIFGVCSFPNDDACSFSVESLQVGNSTFGSGAVDVIQAGGVNTNITARDVPTNFLVDSGIGSVGAAQISPGVPELGIMCSGKLTGQGGCSGTIELNGEKPQGMTLICFEIDPDGNTVNGGFCKVVPSVSQLHSAVGQVSAKMSPGDQQKLDSAVQKLKDVLCTKFPKLAGC